MEKEKVYFNKDDYIETNSGNKISKKSLIRGTEQIQQNGKLIMNEQSIVRGDLAKITIGKYVILMNFVTLHPSNKQIKGVIKFIPLTIGDYVIIEQDSIICASKIGSYVHIGKNCIISDRCIISDNVKILDDTIVPKEMTIPPFTVYGGKPAKFIAELPESVTHIHKEDAINYYYNFISKDIGSANQAQVVNADK